MDGNSSPDDKRIMTPVERWFMLLKHFEEVPLPGGCVFSLVSTELMEKRNIYGDGVTTLAVLSQLNV